MEGQNPFSALKTVFHEPSRLAIVSHLCSDTDGVPFTELKKHCVMTDGNLSRHLRVLEEAGAVRIEKSFVGVKPRTTIFITESGLEAFLDYLSALGTVLQTAARSMEEKPSAAVSLQGFHPPAGA